MQVKIDKKADDRIKTSLKKFKNVIISAKEKNINESDTVTIVTDILVEVLGYDKYEEVTREHAIRNTYCDLAIKLDNKLKILIEVKAIGVPLKKDHLTQVTNYGANLGINWIALTNGEDWSVYHLKFDKPIKVGQIMKFNILGDELEKLKKDLFSISKEGIKKNTINQIYEYQSIINKYFISDLMTSEEVVKLIVRKLEKLYKNSKIENDNIIALLEEEVIKREIIEDNQFSFYKRKSNKI